MDIHSLKRKPTRDHIRSKARFGYEKDYRQVVVCSECNFMKGDKTFEEFIASITLKNMIFEEALRQNAERLIHLNYLLNVGLE